MEKKTIFLLTAIVLLSTFILVAAFYGLTNLLEFSDTGTAARIKLTGTIMPGSPGMFSVDSVDPENFQRLVESAQNEGVDAFLLDINSQGGSVVASKDVARTVESIDEPVACLMRDVAVSGAYWVSTECDYIVADSLTMTGSIGVMSSYLEFTGLMDEYGIEYVNLSSGEYKLAGSPFKELTDDERQIIEDQLETVHKEFKQQVAESRNLSMEDVEELATGETFLGIDAKEKGLIDETGDRRDAINYLEEETNKSIEVKNFVRREGFNILSLLATKIGEGIGETLSIDFERDITQETYSFR